MARKFKMEDKSNSRKILMVLNGAMKNLDYLSLNSGVYIHVPLHTGSSVTRYATVIFSRKNLFLKLYFDTP